MTTTLRPPSPTRTNGRTAGANAAQASHRLPALCTETEPASGWA